MIIFTLSNRKTVIFDKHGMFYGNLFEVNYDFKEAPFHFGFLNLGLRFI